MANFRYDLIDKDCSVLCAVSGGADSMYLLCRLLEGGYSIHAAHYNHQLRASAVRDEQFVRDWCADHGVPLTVGRGDVAAHADISGQGIEEAARELRYSFLQDTAARTGCAFIATGHHAGDNAETVLMNLIRGCGLGGLSGIPERRDNIVRPMLHVTRDEIEAYLTDHGVPHVEDETNCDLSYTRNRIRHQLLPLLEELNPRAAAHIADAAGRCSEDDRELCRQAECLLEQAVEREEGTSIPVSVLLSAPRPVALRVLKELAPGVGAVHLEALLSLCRRNAPSAQLHIPGGTVRRVYADLLFAADTEALPQSVPLHTGVQNWGGWHITCTPAVCPPKAYVDRTHFYLRTDTYLIRSRQEGDLLRLGRRPQKTIKKLMIEGRVPRHLRDHVPILADSAGRAAAAGGLGPHYAALAQPGSQCLNIIIRKGE